jgi:hypothetical protein
MAASLKLLLILPMAVFEILFLGVCWITALAHKPTGRKLTQWSMDNLPAKEWYLSKGDRLE